MAQTATIRSQEQVPRISQLLPTVKCSSCSQPVPLAELGDHLCPPLPPPSPLSLQKMPMPKTATSLLPQRFQSLVSRSATPPASKPCTEKLSGEHGRALPPPLMPLTPAQHDPFQRLPPDIQASKTPTLGTTLLPPQTTPPTAPTLSDRHPIAHSPTVSTPERVSTPVRNAAPPVLQRARTPSNAARPRSPTQANNFPNPFNDTGSQPIPGRPRAGSSARRENLPPPQEPLPPPPRMLFGNRMASNATPPSSTQPRPSLERPRTSSVNSAPRPSLDKSRPSLDKPRPSLDPSRPSLESHHSSTEQSPAAAPVTRPPRRTSTVPALDPPQGTVPFPSSAPPLPPYMSARHPPPPRTTLPYAPAPTIIDREIDTQSGGEAGMAGVGRRGFAAAARAAMFSAPHQPMNGTAPGDGRRFNAPQYLDINAVHQHVMRAAMTPPLSPNSGQTPSPVSPYLVSPSTTPTSGKYPNIPSPSDATFKQSQGLSPREKTFPLSSSSSDVRIVSPSRTPSPIPNPFEGHLGGETSSQSPMVGKNLDLAFLNSLMPEQDPGNESDDESVYTTHTELRKEGKAPMSPSACSDLGLAYADDDDTPVVMPLDVRKSTAKDGTNKVKFPTLPAPDRSRLSGPSRATSNASASSSRTAIVGPSRSRSATQSTARSIGALERAMETLIEEGASVSVLASGSVLASIGGSSSGRVHGKPSRSNTVPGPASPEQKPPKLPTRSHTSPSHPHIHSERVGITGEVARIRNRGEKRKARMCAGCKTDIEDGRWIQMDGGSFLCERCWKNMYLPKCRRCNLPIEKQAVSSRDGQLKGKYHRDCFSCNTCQKPFPDKEFYVFDGKPFCAYHYHEANNSLCAAPSCGQPVEGPCAVTHSGRRFHPEHLLCEFEGECKERLVEYWEVDGQMLCERHAYIAGNRDSGWTRGNDLAGDTHLRQPLGTDLGRVMKRMTRFIDLGAGEDGNADGDGDVDIR